MIRFAGLCCVLALVAIATPVAAQDRAIDVTAAYQFQRVSCSDCADATNVPAGFSLDVSGSLIPMAGWVAQFDVSRKSSDGDATNSFTTFGVGGRWSGSSSGTTPFVQALVGLSRNKLEVGTFSSSDTHLMVEVDGGVAVAVSSDRNTSIVGQIGYRRVAQDLTSGLNILRIVVGVRVKLGG